MGTRVAVTGETTAVRGAFLLQRAHKARGGHSEEEAPVVALLHGQAPGPHAPQYGPGGQRLERVTAEAGVGPAEVVARRDGTVAEIGLAAAADGELAPRPGAALEHKDAEAPGRGHGRAGKAGCPGAQDEYIEDRRLPRALTLGPWPRDEGRTRRRGI